jgi:hypothetical protein
MRRRAVDDAVIVRLYVEERLRAHAIARRLGCNSSVIYERLEKAGVKRTRRAHLPVDELRRLYVQEGWSSAAIGQKFNAAGSTVRDHLRRAGINVHPQVSSRRQDGCVPCPRSMVFRAYVLGLVWGDFAVQAHGRGGQRVRVRTSTTRREQVDLTKNVFGGFGSVTYVNRYLAVSLDVSFRFLLGKYDERIPIWIRGPEASAAFAAGYIDAEGSFGIYEGRARFKIDAYDKDVLLWLDEWCRDIGVESKVRRVARGGDPRPGQPPYRRDLWRLNANDALGIVRLIATLEPYLSHGQRRLDAKKARQNVLKRLRSRIGDQ